MSIYSLISLSYPLLAQLAASSGRTCGIVFDSTLHSAHLLHLRYENLILAATVHVHAARW